MAYKSYREFLNALEKAGELLRVSSPCASELEITEIADREMKKPGGGKALFFEKPTVNGAVSTFPLAINTLGSFRRMALSMEAESIDAVAEELGSLLKAKPPTSLKEAAALLSTALELRHARPKIVKEAACQEVVKLFDSPARATAWPPAPDCLKGERPPGPLPTLLDLPIQQCWPMDGGRFITLPCVVTKDPDTGERNVGMYRMQV
jgi:4-hydroxy-3-polyprenylbenzoate decarboxylase